MSQNLKTSLEKVKQLPIEKQKYVAVIVGSQVADAATRPLHWIYKQDVLDDILKNVDQPEFYPESKSPFYEVELGKTSNYNDILRCTLRFLYSNPSDFNPNNLSKAFLKEYGPGTTAYELTKLRNDLPVKGVWLHDSIIKFVEALQAEKTPSNLDEKTMDAMLAALPLLLVHDAQKVWKEMEKIALLITQNSSAMIYFHAFTILLQECLMGSRDPFESFKKKLEDIQPEVLDKILQVETSTKDFIKTVKEHGNACYIPGTFLGAYLSMKKTQSFKEAVRLNIKAGGCNCSRANIIGACYGALHGIDGIPMDWLEKVDGIQNTIEMTVNVIKYFQ